MELIQLNNSALTILQSIGEYSKEMKGKNIKTIFPELTESRIFQGIDQVIAEKNDLVFENYFPILDKHFTVKIVAFDSGAVLYFHDITDHIRKEQLAKLSTEEAERKNRFKTKLISVINHELRSPVLSLIADAEIIAMSGEKADVKNAAQDMISVGKSVQRLITDLLDFSAAELGKLPVNRDTTAGLRDVLLDVRSILSVKNVISEELLENATGYSLRCEKIRVVQVLVNLLSNAEKYSTDGKITVEHDIKPMSVVFRVKSKTDIHPEKIKFQLFERHPENIPQGEDSISGFGLGLYIVKNILDAIGGYIWVTREDELIVFNTEFPRVTTEQSPVA